jgi:predicted RNase H-like nuclease (RuvC/YqgF family)
MPTNPVITMRVKNNTGAVLERGPILVLDEGTYVGEAILPYTTVEGENHIAYAVDLGVTVKEEYKSGSELQVINIQKRYFQKEYMEWKECEYEVQNKKKDEIDLVIEHPKSDYKVDEKVTQKPTEETESYYRWKFKVKPKSTSKFKVRETIIRYYTEYIRDLGLETIKSYFNNNYISKKDYKDVKEIIDLQSEINKLRRKNDELENERNKIFNEQSRLRSNLESLGTSTREEKLRAKYVDKLDAQEKRLEDIDKEIQKNKDKIEKLDKDIEKLLKSLR